jgi:putative acyl-CoA dehydrogenase
MSRDTTPQPHATHDVINQPPPLVGYNLFETDRALVEGLRREGAGWAEEDVSRFGRLLGGPEPMQWAVQANEYPPVLRTHDRWGRRIDEVEYHPAWHSLMRTACAHGVHCGPWREPRPGAHVARAAKMMLTSENEYGHACPISMTYSVLPALRHQPELAAWWEPRIASLEYDSRFIPAVEKTGVLAGMAMTEKQGGSDVRANTTRAVPAGAATGPGAEYLITGHKWFCSAPMCDVFLTLAQTDRGLSCFLLPRYTPDGERNRFFIQRLKNKLGNRSNASSEIELDGAWARMVGEEGRGVPTIVEMVNHTRLDCVIGSTAVMRQALVQAIHHARHRAAFGRKLVDQPLMANVLADLAIEVEAAATLTLRLARAYDHSDDKEFESPLRRIATAASKYWVCKRALGVVGEALECHGGAGYVEESPLPRMLREAPLNSIWEGSGNVICLDVLRALAREPRTLEALLAELKLGRGADRRLDAHLDALESDLHRSGGESQARRLVEKMALALQASLLVRHAPPFVADAFCASRLAGDTGESYGTLPANTDFGAIIERAFPTA